jgi:hypothetical protein
LRPEVEQRPGQTGSRNDAERIAGEQRSSALATRPSVDVIVSRG